MDRIDKILNHDLFLYHLGKNNAAEADRRFCRHSMVHFLDVARIGTIIALEEGLELDREWIYAAALLHDCGKHEQYENGTPHEQASARIAPEILKDCGFDDKETDVIVTAISRHRDPEREEPKRRSLPGGQGKPCLLRLRCGEGLQLERRQEEPDDQVLSATG